MSTEHETGATPPGTWGLAHRAASAVVAPIQRILAIEATSGLLLVITTAIALFWANSAYRASYHALWATPISVSIGDASFSRPLVFWINDGLMTVFFLVVGMEIRRELYEGHLRTLGRAALPFVAALGGMLAPALIYVALNHGKLGAGGWGIPMATDIAFAVGVLTLLGSRIPGGLRILLLALAVIDDIGAIVVIAVFYSVGVDPMGLLIASAGIGVVLLFRSTGVRSPLIYMLPGAIIWIGLWEAHIHPTLAGVILGLLTPVRPWFGAAGFAAATQRHVEGLAQTSDRNALLKQLDAIEVARREATSPADRLVHVLQPWVAYAIMPLFALANAGVVIGDADLGGDSWFIFLGAALGLAIGKPLGIASASLLAARLGIAQRPAEANLAGLGLVGLVGGIGFTMALFVAQLAFPPGTMLPQLDSAKLGILAGSAAAALLGLGYGLIYRTRLPRVDGEPSEPSEPSEPVD